MISIGYQNATDFGNQVTAGPMNYVLLPTVTAPDLFQILPSRPNRLGLLLWQSAGNDLNVIFGSSVILNSPAIFGVYGFVFKGDITYSLTLEDYGPLIQDTISVTNTIGQYVQWQEWYDGGGGGGQVPPMSGYRRLKELGYLNNGCYNGPQASMVNQMAAALQAIRNDPVYKGLMP